MVIENIVFDFGNVLLRWDPEWIVKQAFPEAQNHASLAQTLFKSDAWRNLNRGIITEQELITHYQQQLNIPISELLHAFQIVKQSLIPLSGSLELLQRLAIAGFPLYALTDNTHGIMAYLKQRYDFWQYFKGIVVSAEIGHLKPEPEIYQYLLNSYQLAPHKTLFFDDWLANVKGAQNCGMHALVFSNAEQCQKDLQKFNINV